MASANHDQPIVGSVTTADPGVGRRRCSSPADVDDRRHEEASRTVSRRSSAGEMARVDCSMHSPAEDAFRADATTNAVRGTLAENEDELRSASPRLEITPYPGPESDDELGPLCPTCKGRGEVDKDDEEDTIALIPVSDNRLKPRKTKLYTALAVFGSLVVCTLLVFFLFERTVSVEIESAYIVDYNVSVPDSVQMTAVMMVSVTNQNYFAVTMRNLTIAISAPEDIGRCAYAGDSDDGSFSASPRSTTSIQCSTVVSFVDDHATLIRDACQQSSTWNNFILLLSTSIRYSYLAFDAGKLERIDWDCFTCRRGKFPHHQIKHSCYNHTTHMVPFEPSIPITVAR